MVSGLDINSADFAVLPPQFIVEEEEEEAAGEDDDDDDEGEEEGGGGRGGGGRQEEEKRCKRGGGGGIIDYALLLCFGPRLLGMPHMRCILRMCLASAVYHVCVEQLLL